MPGIATRRRSIDTTLYRGEVLYGNVGGGKRLGVTVVGPAVNEASRSPATEASG